MSQSNLVYTLCALRSIRAEEPIRHTTKLEKATRDIYIQLAIILATIDKEVDREDSVSISTNVPRCDEGKFWIGSDGVLNTVEAVLGCDG